MSDFCVPVTDLVPDLHRPVQLGVIDLADCFDTVHELRELLESKPLLIHGGYR
jgi:hypothetical protein